MCVHVGVSVLALVEFTRMSLSANVLNFCKYYCQYIFLCNMVRLGMRNVMEHRPGHGAAIVCLLSDTAARFTAE